jgi:hypothetical protein
VPGNRITDRQVTRYMTLRRTNTQEAAAAKVGISVRSARRIETAPQLPSQKPRRWWRSRPGPRAEDWDSEIVPLLAANPGLLATSVLQHLQELHPGRFHGVLRTLQRRIRQWRALSGPPKEIFFPQRHEPGRLGLSDFTDAGGLAVTIAGLPFEHRLYHFTFAFCAWEHVEVIEGGESFVALAHGLQNALWQAGGVPVEHPTDSLPAAFKNLQEEDDFTARYGELCRHYGMTPSRNNRSLAHENGTIEAGNRHLKTALDQALMLRGHRDFDTLEAYGRLVRDVVARRNARVARPFALERAALRALPERRSADFVETEARVTRASAFTVRGILYSAPSRLIGHRLKVRLYHDRLDCFLGASLVLSVPRGHPRPGKSRGRVIDYRHLIDGLKRKPQALKGLTFREELFPDAIYRRTWEALDSRLPARQACRRMVALLELAADGACEGELGAALEALLEVGELPDPEALRRRFRPQLASPPAIEVPLPAIAIYDSLITAADGTHAAPHAEPKA